MFEREAQQRRRRFLVYLGLALGAAALATAWFVLDFSPASRARLRASRRFGYSSAEPAPGFYKLPPLAKRIALFLKGDDGSPGLLGVTDGRGGPDYNAKLAELLVPGGSRDEKELFLLAFMEDRQLRDRWQDFLRAPGERDVDSFVEELRKSGLLDRPAAQLSAEKARRERRDREKNRMLVAEGPPGEPPGDVGGRGGLQKMGGGLGQLSNSSPSSSGGGGSFLAVVSKLEPSEQEEVKKQLDKGASPREACDRAGLAERCKRAVVRCTLDAACRPNLSGQNEWFKAGAAGSAGVDAAGLLGGGSGAIGGGSGATGVTGGGPSSGSGSGSGGAAAAAAGRGGDAHNAGALTKASAAGPDKNVGMWIDSMFSKLSKGQRDLLLSVCLEQDICNPPQTCAAAGLYSACVAACNAHPPCKNGNIMPGTEPTSTTPGATTSGNATSTTPSETTTTDAATTTSAAPTTTTAGAAECLYPDPPGYQPMLCGACPAEGIPGVATCGCGQKMWVHLPTAADGGAASPTCDVPNQCRPDASCAPPPTSTTSGGGVTTTAGGGVTTTAATVTTTPRPTTTTDCSSGVCPPGKVWCESRCRCITAGSICPL